MKRMLILPLCLLLLCGGCGKKSGAAADIQAQYSRIHTAQMEAEVTFHTPQENRSFTLQCAFTPESSTVTVTAPETVETMAYLGLPSARIDPLVEFVSM